jgi:hypothetical protein
MTMSIEPQTWIFPPPWENTTDGFGPVYFDDKILLSWTPPAQQPAISMWCNTPLGQTSTIPITVANISSSPLEYEFQTPANGTTNEDVICHLWFLDSTDGNTIQFQFLNYPASTSNYWTAANKSTHAAPTLSVLPSWATTPAWVTPSSGPDSSSPRPLGPSQRAGIALGCLVLTLLTSLGFFFWGKKRRQRRQKVPAPTELEEIAPPPYESAISAGKPPGYAVAEVAPPPGPATAPVDETRLANVRYI